MPMRANTKAALCNMARFLSSKSCALVLAITRVCSRFKRGRDGPDFVRSKAREEKFAHANERRATQLRAKSGPSLRAAAQNFAICMALRQGITLGCALRLVWPNFEDQRCGRLSTTRLALPSDRATPPAGWTCTAQVMPMVLLMWWANSCAAF